MNIFKRTTDSDELRRYLLGNLPKSRQEQLEQRVLTESEINEELVATEDELIDEYLGEKLSAQERQQFESHFSFPAERQRKIRFGRSLRSYLASLPASDLQRNSKGAKSAFFLTAPVAWLARNPILGMSLALLLCVGTFAVCWLIYQRPTQTGVSQPTLAISLVPGTARSEGSTPRLRRPQAYSTVEVELEIGKNDYQTYQIELLKEHESLKNFKSLQAQMKDGRLVLIVVVDGSLFDVGDYTLKLSGISESGQPEFKDQYQLRVTP
jgi:hypothetical protein